MWTLPVDIIKFWYLEAPISFLKFFSTLNKSFFNAFSLPLMVKTFFRPWKNEYREGLVRFSIFMGIVIKSIFIISGLIIFIALLMFEILIFIAFLAMPVAIFYLPFIRI